MIALPINNYVWQNLRLDTALDAKYDQYRTKYGNGFIPFFPVFDNHAGDISWGSECYVLYDNLKLRPNRDVFKEQREQILYTVVGPIPELFEFKDAILNQFDNWEGTTLLVDGYRVTDVNAWQSTGTSGRDKLRQTYSTTIVLEVNYIPC